MDRLIQAILLIALLGFLCGCTVPEREAVDVIEAQGYTDVTLRGPSLFGCSEDDDLTREFVATAVNGKRVEGVVCAGLFFKGATVRMTKVLG